MADQKIVNAFKKVGTLEKGAVWTDGSSLVTVTNFADGIVEYGFADRKEVFYLTESNFKRSFQEPSKTYNYMTPSSIRRMIEELAVNLKEIKAQNLGDHVYYMMHQLGI